MLASNKRGMAACVKGQPGSETLGSRLGARERTGSTTPGEPALPSATSASSALPSLQRETEQEHPDPQLCSQPTPRFLPAEGPAGLQQQKRGGAARLHRCPQQNQRLSAARPVPCSLRLCTSLTLVPDPPRRELSQREPSPPFAPANGWDHRAHSAGGAPLSRCSFGRCSTPAASSFPRGVPAGPQHDQELLQPPSSSSPPQGRGKREAPRRCRMPPFAFPGSR